MDFALYIFGTVFVAVGLWFLISFFNRIKSSQCFLKKTKKKTKTYWYEVNILVKPSLEEALTLWVNDTKEYFTAVKMYNFRKTVTVTSTGSNLRQPMITFITKESSFEDAVSVCNQMAQILERNISTLDDSFVVVRQQVAGTSINSDPCCPKAVIGTQYYEFHTNLDIINEEEWVRLAKFLIPYSIPLLYNPDSNNHHPVTTYRHYDTYWTDALKKQKELEKNLEDEKFIITRTDYKYSLYDTNLLTDKGWMFLDDPKKFKTVHEYTSEDLKPPKSFIELYQFMKQSSCIPATIM